MRRLPLMTAMVFCLGWAPLLSQGAEAIPFEISAETGSATLMNSPDGKSQYTVIDVTLGIKNTSEKPRTIWLWSCGYTENWTLQSAGLRFKGNICFQNSRIPVTLKSGEVYQRKVEILVKPGFEAEKATYDVGFRPSRPKGHPDPAPESDLVTFWSGEKEVAIRPAP